MLKAIKWSKKMMLRVYFFETINYNNSFDREELSDETRRINEEESGALSDMSPLEADE